VDLGGVAGLRIAGAPFFLHEAVPDRAWERSPDAAGLATARVELFVEDPDAVLERVAAAGAGDVQPVAVRELPWGPHRQGAFTDPFGHHWFVGDRSPLR
jgi:PhnB protein